MNFYVAFISTILNLEVNLKVPGYVDKVNYIVSLNS